MINKKTLFVLGAGASRPYGFPTASELKELILCRFLDQVPYTELLSKMGFRRHYEYISWLDRLLISSGFTLEELTDFRREFTYSAFTSIDRFVSSRPCYERIGPLFIAAILLKCEASFRIEGDWYEFLWNLLADINDAHEVVSFVTFNYDRSLHYYLVRCFQAGFGLDAEEARARVAKFSIIHVYGHLGDLYTDSSQGRLVRWGDFSAIERATEGIRLVRAGKPSVFQARIKDLSLSAERVHFIGFGFSPTNIDAMGLRRQEGALYSASSLSLPKVSQQVAFDKLGRIAFQPVDAYEYLRTTPYLYAHGAPAPQP